MDASVDKTFLDDTKDLEIKLEHDAAAKTLSMVDSDVGMSKTNLINNVGAVAKSEQQDACSLASRKLGCNLSRGPVSWKSRPSSPEGLGSEYREPQPSWERAFLGS